jgi:hypothetical protein
MRREYLVRVFRKPLAGLSPADDDVFVAQLMLQAAFSGV